MLVFQPFLKSANPQSFKKVTEEHPTYKTDANQAEGKGPRSDLPKWPAEQTPGPDLPSEKNG